MYATKILKPDSDRVMLYQSTWLVPETFTCNELIIRPHAVLKAPEGKFLTLTVDGVGQEITPGKTYTGEVVLSVTDAYHMAPGGLMEYNQISRDFHTAIVVEDGKVTHTVPAIIQGGEITDTGTKGVYIASNEKSFNGIVVSGDSEYTIRDVRADFDGFGDNDFLGVGCAVTAVGNSKVTVEDCDFTVNGVTRCALHAGGHSQVLVKNTRLLNQCPADEWPGSFSWQIGFCGSTRVAQLSDSASITYDGCDLRGNGWGVLSIDGWDGNIKMTVKNSRIRLSGPRAHGYGAFCIGDNEVIYDNCDVDVYGYPLFLMGQVGKGRASILNSRITGRRFGVFVNADDNSVVTIRNSSFRTAKSTFCVKGSATIFNVERTEMEAGNGTIVQLMDEDECGMNVQKNFIPVGEEDTALPDRDLFEASESEDVIFRLKNCLIKGNFYNSTTNIRAYTRAERGDMGEFHDDLIGLLPMMAITEDDDGDSYGNTIGGRHHGDDLRGPKNLGLELTGTTIEGIISSASQKYRDGLTVITEANRMDMSNVTQAAAPTVNNGVVVSLDGKSAWIVTGTSYLTSLTLAPGAEVRAANGGKLTMTVDGVETPIQAGCYQGRIVLTA